MLEALREWDPKTHDRVEERLKYSVAQLAEFMDLPLPLRLCDLNLSGDKGGWPPLRAEACSLSRVVRSDQGPLVQPGKRNSPAVAEAEAAAAKAKAKATAAEAWMARMGKAGANAEMLAAMDRVEEAHTRAVAAEAVAGEAVAAEARAAAETPRCQCCEVLTDTNHLRTEIIHAARYHLRGTRSGGLRALRQVSLYVSKSVVSKDGQKEGDVLPAYYLLAYYLFTQGFTGEDRQLETDAARVKEEQQLEPYEPL